MITAAGFFNRIAARYDHLWTNTTAGRLQRDAVWRHLRPLVHRGQRLLDVGCGTGEDALWMAEQGARVLAVDAAGGMVAVAQQRGVDARALAIQQLGETGELFDGVISNFGAVNCVPLNEWTASLARTVRPGGVLAVCVIGRFCLWETLWFTLTGQLHKAARRWSGNATASGGLVVYYPRINEIENALGPSFALLRTVGVGIFVPPSCVTGVPDSWLRRFAVLDSFVETNPAFRILADHRLLVFRRT